MPSSAKDTTRQTDRKLTNCFSEHLMGNHKEAAKLVSLHFNSSDHKDCDHKDEEDIATTALKF